MNASRTPWHAIVLAVITLMPRGGACAQDAPPPVPREFRAAWVATVANIDWPSAPGLPVARQKAELIQIMDAAAALKLNALIFQVRPACDALYASKIEPWSEYLTGVSGKAPNPLYDPLEMAVNEAHKRGIELHAWFNPYRARHPSAKSPVPPDHVSKRKPAIVRQYGKHLWLDPAEPETRKYSLSVILDVVRRYDVDGIHLDDYFYPYKEKDSAGSIIDFPDESTWQRYRASGGKLSRDDWRRDGVNRFIEMIYTETRRIKPWVKFGISPFGIWRPGNPEQIRGFDAYAEIYADSKLWLQKAWVDYFTPQLYWPIAQTAQSYPVLLKWWAEQNTSKRHLWPGNYTSRVRDGSATAWRADEVIAQIDKTRAQHGATGNVHFSMKALQRNVDGLADLLKKGPYAQAAAPPASPWMSQEAPRAPKLERQDGGRTVTVQAAAGPRSWLWAVHWQTASGWRFALEPAARGVLTPPPGATRVVVRALNRYANESPASIVSLVR